jgi:hypothetical protein
MAWAGGLETEEALIRAKKITSEGTKIEMSWTVNKAASLDAAEKRGCRAWVDLASGSSHTLSPGKGDRSC